MREAPVLVIRAAQREALAAVQEANFRARVVEHLDRTWPAFQPRPERLADFAHEAIDAARAFGLHVERDVMLFVLVAVVLGPRFAVDDPAPWVDEILGHESLGPSEKMELVVERLAQRLGDGTDGK